MPAGFTGLVGLGRLDAAVIDGDLLEVGEDRQRELGGPGIAAQLVGGGGVGLDIDGGFLGLDEELADPADAEAVIGGLGRPADLDRVLVDDVLVGLGVALLVVDVPAEGFEERVDELAADLGLVVAAAPGSAAPGSAAPGSAAPGSAAGGGARGTVGVGVLGEALDELEDRSRGGLAHAAECSGLGGWVGHQPRPTAARAGAGKSRKIGGWGVTSGRLYAICLGVSYEP